MLVHDILEYDDFTATTRQVLLRDCSEFIRESGGQPLFKTLPTVNDDFRRVKVRQQKRRNGVSEVFEQAFGSQFNNFRQRSIFTSSTLTESDDPSSMFYVFPIDGYKFMYSKEVTNSNNEYQTVIETLMQGMESAVEATQLVTDLVKYTYTATQLQEGIASGAEVILYGIPYYYAVRTTVCADYTDLITR